MTLEPIIDQINAMNTNELIAFNNLYCQESANSDNEIFDNDAEFFDNYLPNAHDALQKAFYGSYNFNDKYVKFNGYANLESINYFDAKDLPDSLEVIAEYCYDNQQYFDMIDFEECDEDVDEDFDEDFDEDEDNDEESEKV